MFFNENSFQAIQKVFETNNINSEINESNASHIENIVRGETSISRGRIIPLRETYDLNLEYMNPFTKKPCIKKKTINVKN